MSAVRVDGDSEVDGVITPKPRQRTELKCRFCEKSYFKTEHLLRHERSHTKEKPFQCTSCGKNFGRRDALLRHLRHSSRLHKSVGETKGILEPWTAAEIIFHSSRDSEASVNTSISQQMTNDSPRRDDQQLQVSEEIDVSEINQTTSGESHNNDPWARLETQPWWLEQDLNLEAFDTSLFDPSGLDEPWFQPLNLDLNSEKVLPMLSNSVGQEFIDSNVQKAWFTYVGGPYNRDVSKLFNGVEPECQQELNDSFDLGDSFRARVSKRLNTQQNTDPLPSTPYLNQSIKTYFTKVVSIFPIIHSQTFKPSRENSLLLIIMCSLGSIVHGTGISHHGTRIFERFNKALPASWETTLLSTPEESVALIQAAFLGQMFGILSGNPQHLAVADALHGTIIAWARRSKLFSHIPPRIEREDLLDPQLGSAKLEDGWRCWGKSESILRTILGLYILDSHLATVFHHDPLLRHDSMETQRPADDELFNAPTAQEWKARMLNNIPKRAALHRCLHINLPDHSPSEPQMEELLCKNNRLTAYCVLQSISAMISESRTRGQLDYGSKKFNEICDALMCWCSTYELPNPSSQHTDLLGLTVLWHATFMKLLTNFDKVERALGRDGADTQYLEDDLSCTLEWASSISADRSILHAQVIQETLCQMSLDTDPAIHIPHCAFMAGITCYSVMHFRRPARRSRFGSTFPPTISRQPSEFPEFNIRGKFSQEHLVSSAPVLFENHIGEQLMRTIGEPREVHHVGPDIFRLCYDVLDRMGHCGNAKRYGDTLLALIRPEIEKWAVMG